MLCEINPLIVTPEGEVRALDSKFTVDDNALFRHPEIAEMRDAGAADPLEALAREKGVTYVKLDGDVGVLGNGAGLTMSTVDVVTFAGGRPANFCDLGGGGGCAGRGRRARGDHQRSSGTSDLLQHLRGDHALRRGCARDPAGGRADGNRPSARRQARRDERRGGSPDSWRRAVPNLHTEATMLERRGRVELAAMTDVWSERAEALPAERGPSRGPRPGPPDRRVGGGRRHGGRRRDRRRPRGADAFGKAGLQVVTSDRAPGCAPTSFARPRTCRSRTARSTSSRAVSPRITSPMSRPCGELARVSRDHVLVVDNLFL